jgi:hypothetical protein
MTAEAAVDLVASVPDLQATDQYLFRVAGQQTLLPCRQKPGVESVRDL